MLNGVGFSLFILWTVGYLGHIELEWLLSTMQLVLVQLS